MEFDNFTHGLGLSVQVFFLDLLLSGDNALVIALACRNLPRPLMARAVMLGTGFAILLRVLLTALAGWLLTVPLLKLVGAVLLLIIAFKLLLADEAHGHKPITGQQQASQLGEAVLMVITADLVLSLDNVVALAAATQGSVLFLIVGLLLSVPFLMYGSLFIARWLKAFPLLVPAGAALLAWIAGQIGTSDPLIADWVQTQSPALAVVVPALCVVFVLVESRIIREQRGKLAAPPSLFAGMTRRLSRFGEAQLAPPVQERSPAPLNTEAANAAASTVEPVALERPAAVSVSSRSVKPARPDPSDASLVKLLIWFAVGIGVLGLGWILLHVFSQGFMPAPEHHPAQAVIQPRK